MNIKLKEFARNLSYTLSSNLITMIVSAMVVFVVPKLIGIEEYGYWQLFMFYSSYVPFFQLGWTDGIYLRYGGERKESLNNQLFYSQFILLLGSQILIAILMVMFSKEFIHDYNKAQIIRLTSSYMILVNTRYLFTYILQATNRFKEFSRIIICDRFIYAVMIIITLLLGVRKYQILIYADLVGKVISLLLSIYVCRDFALLNINKFKVYWNETLNNIRAGIKMMFSNTASMLIIGFIRLGIERTWDVAIFGKVSLTLSISNFMMIFINAVGVIMFPMLRRTEEDKLSKIYNILSKSYSFLIFGILFLYYPLKEILLIWLPAYSDSLVYMALLFPISVYEGKMALLINPYLKTLRKESLLLKINVAGFLVSIVASLTTSFVIQNLNLAVLSIVIVLGVRCILSELILSRILNINVASNIIIETILVIIFIILGWMENSLVSGLVYLLVYSVFLYSNRYAIQKSVELIKSNVNLEKK